MLKDITLGQFFPGETIAHKLDPRTKLILVVVYIIALFQAAGWVSYAVITVVTALCLKLSRVSWKNIFKGLKPMLFIIVLTAVLNIFLHHRHAYHSRLAHHVAGHRAGHTDDTAHLPAYKRHLPSDLHHKSHRPDRRT